MAEANQEADAHRVTGFERYETEVLMTVYRNQLNGMAQIHEHEEKGTIDQRRKPGAATPREFGGVLVMLYDNVKAELIKRGELE